MSQFPTPMHNDFQWKNLYMKQYGVCTYAPPLSPNPSTTTITFPKRKDIQPFLGDLDDNGEEDYTTMETVHRKALSRKETFFSIADNFCDESGSGSGGPNAASMVAAALSGSSRPGRSSSRHEYSMGTGHSSHRKADGFIELVDDTDLFTPAFFDFLKARNRKHSAETEQMGSSVISIDGISIGNSISHHLYYNNVINPYRLPAEIFQLQSDAWMLLMDNRGMAWLEREADKKGRNATSIRQRLLEVATGPSIRAAWDSLPAEDKRSLQGGVLAPVPLTEEEASQRIYESFTPFFAVISAPSIVRRLRDQFMASRRAQARGLPGPAADTVGLPLFSQFATWRECYESRQRWNCTPFSFFLIHDASYNFAQISAIYTLLQVVDRATHTHSATCLETKGDAIELEGAGRMLAQSRSARRHVETQRNMCPLLAVQQLTEDLLLIFEQSSSRTTLNMAMHVCSFLTDCVLDPETAARFFSPEALSRQSAFTMPAMDVAKPTSPSPKAGSPIFPTEKEESSERRRTGTPSTSEATQKSRFDLFGLRHFSDTEFEALFELSFWFIDSAIANSRVPVDPMLMPAQPRFAGHPEMAFHHLNHKSQIEELGSTSLTLSSSRHVNPSKGRSGGARSIRSMRRSSPFRGVTRQNVPGEYGSLPSLSGINVSPKSPRAATGAGGAANALRPKEHSYLPGKMPQYSPVGSLVEAIALYEVRLTALVEKQQRDNAAQLLRSANLHKSSSMHSSRSHKQSRGQSQGGSVTGGEASVDGGTGSKKSVSNSKEENLSPVTTLLSTPLIFLSTYTRLHGAPWLKHLFDRLFNILRRESVLLYVNRLDLEDPFSTVAGPFAGASSSLSMSSRSISMIRDASPMKRSNGDASMPTFPAIASSSALGGGYSPSYGSSALPSSHLHNVPFVMGPEDSTNFLLRMERLEDLICQDIQYVMNEFFSALHGRRSATRLPQGITALLTQFTSTIHLHLLSNVILISNDSIDRPGAAAAKVQEHLLALKQKRMAGKAFRTEHMSDASMNRLICNIDQHRLTKFLLFDSWIIPALNDVVASGYLSESSSMHLRWNIDAFARYLKILVNAPFVAAEHQKKAQLSNPVAAKVRAAAAAAAAANAPSRIPSPGGGQGSGKQSRKKTIKESTTPPCTLKLPPLISGIYDISSGTLVRVYTSPALLASAEAQSKKIVSASSAPSPRGSAATSRGSKMAPAEQSTSAVMATSRTMVPPLMGMTVPTPPSTSEDDGKLGNTAPPSRFAPTGINIHLSEPAPVPAPLTPLYICKATYFTCMDDATWDDVSTSLRTLNEMVGIVGYDPDEETNVFQMEGATGFDDHCAMRVLDMFCRRSSMENSTNVVVSEFEVLPSIVAGCIDKVYSLMTGKHPLVEHAIESEKIPAKFSFSPYLHCLNGVLLHPKTAARALDNVYFNSRRFYNTLMRPVEDESLLNLISSIIVDKDDLPMVDSNSLMPLLSCIPGNFCNGRPTRGRGPAAAVTDAVATAGHGGGLKASEGGQKGTGPGGRVAQQGSLAYRYEQEARKLKQHQIFLATGAEPSMQGIQRLFDRVGPDNPMKVLQAGRDVIQRESLVVPTCFDPWWRAMAMALCVKAMTVFSECSPQHSDGFIAWCNTRKEIAKRESKFVAEVFVQQKGKEFCTAPAASEAGKAIARARQDPSASRRKRAQGSSRGSVFKSNLGSITGGSSSVKKKKRAKSNKRK